VSLVVVAYRDPRSLRGMMTPLVGSDLELIVVNVTCDPDVEAVCRDLGLRHVPLEGNRGFAAAVNIGADLASGRVLVFANDDLGVTDIVIPRVGKPGANRRSLEKRRPFQHLVKWRTGCEGRISFLKRCHGWNRTRLDGIEGATTWCGWGVLTHNSVKIAKLAA